VTIVVLIVLLALAAGAAWERWGKPPPAPPSDEPDAPSRPARSMDTDRNLAVHEAGHAVTAWACTMVQRIDRIDLDADEGRRGITVYDYFSHDSDDALWCSIVIGLGGVAAELMVDGKVRSGPAENDLLKARQTAAKLCARGVDTPPWGDHGHVRSLPLEKMYTTLSTGERQVLDHAYRMARALVWTYRPGHTRLVKILLAERKVSEIAVVKALGPRRFFIGNFISSMLRQKPPKAWFYIPAYRGERRAS
jgi:ATP-dependent Zn protease